MDRFIAEKVMDMSPVNVKQILNTICVPTIGIDTRVNTSTIACVYKYMKLMAVLTHKSKWAGKKSEVCFTVAKQRYPLAFQ